MLLQRQVSGNADLDSVRDIKLQVMSGEMSLHRLALFVPNLRELNLDGSFLGSLRDLGCDLASLNILRVSRCGLVSLDGTFGLTHLRELHASHNMVHDAGPCSSLSHIRVIDLGKNAVEDVRSLEFLNICSHLEDLTLAECPVSSKTGYQARIQSLLPNLVTLDGIPVQQDGEEQNIENNDDDDNDIDGGAGYPHQDFFRPSSRCYTFRHHRLGASVSQHPTPNEDGHGKEEGATIFDRSNMSNEEDSPDCSSSSYQTFTNLHSTQSNSSDSTLSQNRKKTPHRVTSKRRPATAVGVTDTAEETHGRTRKPRPSSAATTTDDGDLSGVCVVDPRCDCSSVLTSGLVVCGNLTAALRSRRKRHDAWTEEDSLSALECRTETPKTEVKQPGDADESNEGDEMWDEEPGILEESKTWNELYAAHRPENRFRWEKEEANSAESVADTFNRVQTNMEEIATEENKKAADVVNKSQIKAPSSCCPHLFSRHISMPDTSYDADTSSNLELSPKVQSVKKKKFLHLSQKQ